MNPTLEPGRVVIESARSATFFRDSTGIAELERVLAALSASKRPGSSLRAWVPLCGSGEEAFSIAILAQEVLTRGTDFSIQVFATDLGSAGLASARSAHYPLDIARDVPPRRLERFFEREAANYRIVKRVRDTVVFSTHDLDRDPPFSRLDLVAVRNLSDPGDSALAARLCALFHYALVPGGYLVVESGQTWPAQTLFSVEGGGVFRRSDSKTPLESLRARGAMTGTPGEYAGAASSRGSRASIERIVLENYAPACIVFNERHEIVRLFGRTGEFLEAPEGEPTHDLLAMVRSELRADVRTFLRRAMAERKRVSHRLESRLASRQRDFELVLEPLPGSHPHEGLWALLIDADARGGTVGALHTASERLQPQATKLERELAQTREALERTTREFEEANERFNVSNEELLSMNEELAATNEELESTKEMLERSKLESDNLNAELEVRLRELGRANSDIKNLLDNTRIATLFLDHELRIRAFTPAIRELFNFIDTDCGRPLGDIAPRFGYESLERDVAHVLADGSAKEVQIELPGRRWFVMRVLPYRSFGNRVEGVVVTFSEITAIKESERQQRLIAEIGLQALECNDFDDFVGLGLRSIVTILGADLAEVCQRDEQTGELRTIASIGFEPADPSSALGPAEVLDEHALEDQELINIPDLLPARLTNERVVSGARAPIWAAHRQSFGLIAVYGRTPRHFSQHERGFLHAVAQVFTTALQRRNLDRELSRSREAALLASSQEQLRRAERLDSLATFAAGIAHEVNNPLSNIALAADYARRTADPARRDSMMTSIIKNAQRCARIVEGVLSFARDETTHKWRMPINELLLRSAEFVRASADPQRFELAFELLEPSPHVECNPAELEQVFVNLMKNALEASPGKCRIELRSQRVAGKVRISIADDGPGIAIADKARVFDPFFSTRRNAGGTGLGLSIAHRIVTSLGGTITVAPDVGRGTRFEIELPEGSRATEA